MKTFLLLTGLFLFSGLLSGQDTFYVKKKNTPAWVTGGAGTVVAPEYDTDSIISYTVEYQRPGTNTWVVLHMTDPYLIVPSEAYSGGGTRVWFRDIMAIDASGRKYKQADRMWKGGVWVTLDEKRGQN